MSKNFIENLWNLLTKLKKIFHIREKNFEISFVQIRKILFKKQLKVSPDLQDIYRTWINFWQFFLSFLWKISKKFGKIFT